MASSSEASARTSRASPVTSAATTGVACQEADDGVKDGDNAVDNGHDDATDTVDNGHNSPADSADAVLDARHDGAHFDGLFVSSVAAWIWCGIAWDDD